MKVSCNIKCKCIKSLYKSTYGKNAFTKNRIYTIVAEDEQQYYILDSQPREFDMFKQRVYGVYFFEDYFQMIKKK